ncbi:hypothetical protein EGM30_17340 [Salmonella enterica subsp. enterica]|nr:hypothetical protein [Salmonella enterica subsp. enterica serovar Lisboa]
MIVTDFDCSGFLYDVWFGYFLKVPYQIYCYYQDNISIKGDDLLPAIVGRLRAYPSRRYWRSQFGHGQRAKTGAYT